MNHSIPPLMLAQIAAPFAAAGSTMNDALLKAARLLELSREYAAQVKARAEWETRPERAMLDLNKTRERLGVKGNRAVKTYLKEALGLSRPSPAIAQSDFEAIWAAAGRNESPFHPMLVRQMLDLRLKRVRARNNKATAARLERVKKNHAIKRQKK